MCQPLSKIFFVKNEKRKLKSNVANKKHNSKPVLRMRAETRRPRVPWFDLSWDCVHHPTKIDQCLARVHNVRKMPQVFGLGVTDKFRQIGEFANMESANKEDRL